MTTVIIDPFRFAAALPTDTVASGSYTGNGATDRTIALAFTPKLVVLINETANEPIYFSNISPSSYGFWVNHATNPFQRTVNNFRPAVTTNGFIVSGNTAGDTNRNSTVYHYFAFG